MTHRYRGIYAVREYSMYDGADAYVTQIITNGMFDEPLWGTDEANKVRLRRPIC